MDKLIKFFPFLPKEKDGNQLILAIVFYIIVPAIAGGIVPIILGLSLILAPLIPVASLLLLAYSVVGIICAIMSYNGHDFSGENQTGENQN